MRYQRGEYRAIRDINAVKIERNDKSTRLKQSDVKNQRGENGAIRDINAVKIERYEKSTRLMLYQI